MVARAAYVQQRSGCAQLTILVKARVQRCLYALLTVDSSASIKTFKTCHNISINDFCVQRVVSQAGQGRACRAEQLFEQLWDVNWKMHSPWQSELQCALTGSSASIMASKGVGMTSTPLVSISAPSLQDQVDYSTIQTSRAAMHLAGQGGWPPTCDGNMDAPALRARQAPVSPKIQQLYRALATEAPRRLHARLLRLRREEGIYFVESFVGDLRESHDSNVQLITAIEMSRITVNAAGPVGDAWACTNLRRICAQYNKMLNITNAQQRAATGWRALARRGNLNKVGEAAFWAGLGGAASITFKSLVAERKLPSADRVFREVWHKAFKASCATAAKQLKRHRSSSAYPFASPKSASGTFVLVDKQAATPFASLNSATGTFVLVDKHVSRSSRQNCDTHCDSNCDWELVILERDTWMLNYEIQNARVLVVVASLSSLLSDNQGKSSTLVLQLCLDDELKVTLRAMVSYENPWVLDAEDTAFEAADAQANLEHPVMNNLHFVVLREAINDRTNSRALQKRAHDALKFTRASSKELQATFVDQLAKNKEIFEHTLKLLEAQGAKVSIIDVIEQNEKGKLDYPTMTIRLYRLQASKRTKSAYIHNFTAFLFGAGLVVVCQVLWRTLSWQVVKNFFVELLEFLFETVLRLVLEGFFGEFEDD
ncbi:hypothetical protein IE81DRAFT_361645 [Ceraceosorus guamensis]|uniref:Uncharacterized protein n=1 Tax=Ceraceosorus guamensis TaxID=1522189 RepID=A0A316W7L6_9BASI|nr:hypothetical protein IE81DRAFT_361645 [Ceraceosorus guamensis]PWN45128.1 hypothetical protein IE81DRAFT_361645 [Ceraceosorus guamensis]